jgi:hypothetical protein
MIDTELYKWNLMGLDDEGGYFSHRPQQDHSGIEAPVHPDDEMMFAEAEEHLEIMEDLDLEHHQPVDSDSDDEL